MLTQSSTVVVFHPAIDHIRIGPVYRCFICGAQAAGPIPWPVNPASPCRLDDSADNIWYMVRPCGCQGQGRFARLGDCITPLELPNDKSKPYLNMVEENIQAVRAALQFTAQHVPEGDRAVDAPTRLVLQLVAGLIAPVRAIEEIRALMQCEANGPASPAFKHGVSQ